MFTDLKTLVIPNGEVVKVTSGTTVLWEKVEEVLGRIPREYQEVEWIAVEGALCYIDLGFAFDTKARIEMTHHIYPVSIQSASTGYIFGATENSGKLRCLLTSPNNRATSCLFYGSTGSAYKSITVPLQHDAINEFVFTLEPGKLYGENKTIGGSKTDTSQGTYTMTNHLYLFAQNYNGTARQAGYNKISVFKYYDKNDTLICDLVPCYRKSDGIIGMYDLVRETFFTKLGTGAFKKGADVTYTN